MLQEKVGKKIRELRIEKEVSQESLGWKSNLDRTYISSVERGKRNISIKNLFKIVHSGLNMNLSDFFKEIEDEYYE